MTEGKHAYVTKEGLEKLKEELSTLKTAKRREIAERIQQAKELGDLSENAEYVEAKNEQAFTEGRILEIEEIVRNALIIPNHNVGDVVKIGSSVTSSVGDTTATYVIVGSNESDPAAGRVSNESPIGSAFLGKRAGEKVEVQTPRGVAVYTILGIK